MSLDSNPRTRDEAPDSEPQLESAAPLAREPETKAQEASRRQPPLAPRGFDPTPTQEECRAKSAGAGTPQCTRAQSATACRRDAGRADHVPRGRVPSASQAWPCRSAAKRRPAPGCSSRPEQAYIRRRVPAGCIGGGAEPKGGTGVRPARMLPARVRPATRFFGTGPADEGRQRPLGAFGGGGPKRRSESARPRQPTPGLNRACQTESSQRWSDRGMKTRAGPRARSASRKVRPGVRSRVRRVAAASATVTRPRQPCQPRQACAQPGQAARAANFSSQRP